MFSRFALATIALAVTTQAAVAQDAGTRSHVTLYGIVDTGIEFARTSGGAGTGHLTSIASGSNAASRLGIHVREDLGGGMYAGARLEHGLESDTGANTSAAKFWNRASFATLGGTWGEVRLGREYTPAFYVLQQGDINGLNLYANAGTFTQLGPNNFARTDNGVNYISPAFANVTVRATVSAGVESAMAPKDSGRVQGISAIYNNKTVMLGAFHQIRRDVFPANGSATDRTAFSGIAARWNASRFSIGAGASRWDPAGPDTATTGVLHSWWLGAIVKLNVGELRAQAGKLRRDTTTAPKPDAMLYGVSYLYPLSKRTTVYGTYGRLNNNGAGNFRLEASSRQVALPVANGVDTSAISIGITHRF